MGGTWGYIGVSCRQFVVALLRFGLGKLQFCVLRRDDGRKSHESVRLRLGAWGYFCHGYGITAVAVGLCAVGWRCGCYACGIACRFGDESRAW